MHITLIFMWMISVPRSSSYWCFFFWVQLFDKVEVFKPPASRSASAETYLLGLGYKAPGKIDPRLLDYRHLFKETAEPTRKVITMSYMAFLEWFLQLFHFP